MELDPHHFFKVGQEPVHHEHPYFESDYDIDERQRDEDLDDDYYEGMIGYSDDDYYSRSGSARSLDLNFSSDADSNDIQFSINEDVQFKLDTSDNYEGRDVDIGITMPQMLQQ